MKTIKWGCFYFKININMEVIESFFSLGYTKVEVNKDLLRLMKLPNTKRIRDAVNDEIEVIPAFTLADLKDKVAEMGLMGDYYSLTPQQILSAYDGYIKFMYNLGNLYIVAERKSQDKNAEPFIFNQKVSRKDTFKKVGLEVK